MGATLLLADDSITIQRVIELTFADEDIRVLVASDGQQAIQKIDAERPDIVLADIGMPRVDGYGVATHVKQSAALRHIPVLLLTGAFEPIDENRARQTGCDGVLVKPFEPQQLVARVKELLAGTHGAELWPAQMPRAQAEPVPQVRSVLSGAPEQIAAPPLSVPSLVEDAVFDLGDAKLGPAEPAVMIEGEDVANRNDERNPRQTRPELPPPADRLDSELDMLDAALSRLDPTAHPQELDEETASDFARDLNELRNEARADDRQPRPARPTFGDWDLPSPAHHDARGAEPTDIVAEEIHRHAPAVPTPEAVQLAPAAQPAPATQVAAPVRPVPPAAMLPPLPAAPPAAVTTFVTPAPAPAPAPAALPATPAAPMERPTLAAAFGALLAAEKSHPGMRASAAPAQLSEAAIEEVVRRVLARMTNETVNRVVLETAERMIREEISRTKDPFGR